MAEKTQEIVTTLDAGTYLLIAEILRIERGLPERPLHDVKRMVFQAIRNLGAKGVQ